MIIISNLPAKHLEQRFMVLLDLEREKDKGDILLNICIEEEHISIVK